MGVQYANQRIRKPSLDSLKPSPRDLKSIVERRCSQNGRVNGRERRSSSTKNDQRRSDRWESNVTMDSSVADATSATSGVLTGALANVAADVRKVMKIFDHKTSLPYEDVPPDLCQPMAGTRSIDLTHWSLLVNDNALRCIAMEERNRVNELAEHRSTEKMYSHIDNMGLASEVKEVSSAGVVRFDVTSLVGWREKQTLDRLKNEEFRRFQEFFMSEVGLTSLDVAGAEGIGDVGLVALTEQCHRLKDLNISGARKITDVAIRSLASNCSDLTRLNLNGCLGVTGPGLAAVGECCPKLMDLDVSACKQIRHWALARVFRGCHELETLSLAQCPRVGDEELKELGLGCRKLIKLDLRDCIQVSDRGLLEVARGCSKLEGMNLSRSELSFKIGDVTLLALGEGCPGLLRLDVAGCDAVTDAGLSWMSKGCPALEYLDIAGCVKVTSAGITSVCESCPLLVHLGMARLKHVTDTGVARLAAGCSKLRYLDMSGLIYLSDGKQRDFALTGLQGLARYCSELEVLVLDKCSQIAKTSLQAIGSGLHSLSRLSMSFCPDLTLDGMSAVASGCSRLTDLNLSNCGGAVTDAAISAFARGCQGLQRLSLRGITGIPPPLGATGILAVSIYCRELTFLDLEEVRGLEDSALAGFHEHRMENLKHVSLMNCPKITGAGIEWLAEGCPALSSLNVKGTGASLTVLSIINERYPYCSIKVSKRFFGLAPLKNTKQRITIARHATLHKSALRIQCIFRVKKATEELRFHRRKRIKEKTARMLCNIWRKKRGRAHLQALRLLKNREENGAVVLQRLWRRAIARSLADWLRRERCGRERTRSAMIIQRHYRGLLRRRKTHRWRVEVLKIRERRIEASITIQRKYRMIRAKTECRKLRQAAERLRLKRHQAVRVLGTRWRSYQARQKLKLLRRLFLERKAREKVAAAVIQKIFRASRCRKILERKRSERARKHASSIIIQRHYRGYCARVIYAMLCARREEEMQLAAAIKLQCLHRLTISRKIRTMLAIKKHLREVQEQNGAKIIQQYYRRHKIRMEALQAKREREEEVLAMARLEDWAATRIQALARGATGRARAKARCLEHKPRWRELFDEERGAVFYYNKVTGEVRWRRPQDLLDLLPRPACGDCGLFEAFCECAGCGEFFCSACFGKVHGGGKRIYHDFRALYDYYGRRVDYGEGEFPSRWPTDIAQDDQNGWRIRVSPEREACEQRGDWTRYAHDGGGSYPGKDLYYNAATGESTYYAPTEWDWAGAGASPSHTFETSSYEEEGNNYWNHPDTGTQVAMEQTGSWGSYGNTDMTAHEDLGESGRRQASLQEQYQTSGEGVLMPAEGSGWSSTGDWSKHYDEEYGVDYYYNYRTSQTQYQRPPDFETPREDQVLEWRAVG